MVSEAGSDFPSSSVVVKTVYENHSVQVLSVSVKAVEGKKGQTFALDIMRASHKLRTVEVDFSTLKDLNDALLEASPIFGEFNSFPLSANYGASSKAIPTPAQINERAVHIGKVKYLA